MSRNTLIAAVVILSLSINISGIAFNRNAGPSCEAPQETPQRHIQEAREAFQKKNYGQAKAEAKRAITLDKQATEAYVLLAMINRREGKWTDAAGYVEQALKLEPNNSDAHYIRGLLRFQKNDFAGAREEANFVIAQGPLFPNVYILLAQAELAIHQFAEALSALEAALKLTRPDQKDVAVLQSQIEALKGWIDFSQLKRDPSYVQPKLLNAPQLVYSEQARAAGIQGTIRLAVLVDETGKVQRSLVLLGLGFGLDEKATEAVQKLKFTPAMKDQIAVPFWRLVEVEFHLKRK